MFSLTRNLSLTMAAAVALAILTASFPASSYDDGQSWTALAQQQRALPYKAIDGREERP